MAVFVFEMKNDPIYFGADGGFNGKENYFFGC